jgi:hypothetical protein
MGNAVVIDGCILIDVGVPFKALRGVYKGLRLVLLTHEHGDHFNPATITRLASERPTLRFGAPHWLVGHLVECGVEKRRIDVFNEGVWLFYGEPFPVTVYMSPTVHNVRNCAWHISIGGKWVFYATDTNSLDTIAAKGYALYLVEANYGETEIVERIRQKESAGIYCHEWDVLNNHLSREKADNWLYSNMGPTSRYVYLHEHAHTQ